jgi:hypothetical protein
MELRPFFTHNRESFQGLYASNPAPNGRETHGSSRYEVSSPKDRSRRRLFLYRNCCRDISIRAFRLWITYTFYLCFLSIYVILKALEHSFQCNDNRGMQSYPWSSCDMLKVAILDSLVICCFNTGDRVSRS